MKHLILIHWEHALNLQGDPYLIEKEVGPNESPLEGNDKYDGFCAELAKKIADVIKIDYEIRPVADGKYGAKDDNGTWNGMVGELISQVSRTKDMEAQGSVYNFLSCNMLRIHMNTVKP